MIKFSHTLFALPFAVLGAALAARVGGAWRSRPQDWLGILISMATARSAAMAFNRLADRKLDALNPRTAMRHLPAGKISAQGAWAFTIVMSLGFIASTLIYLPNRLPLWLSLPVLAWILAYSFAKRFTALAHVWLGVSLAMAPVAAWIAIRGSVALPPLCLGAAVLFWVTGFDIIYACQDLDFDRSMGLKSIPARFGTAGALKIAAAAHAAMVLALIGLGAAYPMGSVYWVGVAATACLLVCEHRLVRPGNLAKVNVAFFQMNVAIGIGLLIVGVADLLRH